MFRVMGRGTHKLFGDKSTDCVMGFRVVIFRVMGGGSHKLLGENSKSRSERRWNLTGVILRTKIRFTDPDGSCEPDKVD